MLTCFHVLLCPEVWVWPARLVTIAYYITQQKVLHNVWGQFITKEGSDNYILDFYYK